MAIEFTISSRQNLSTKFKSQDDATVASSVGGVNVNFAVKKPQAFEDITVSDSVELSDLLEDAVIDFRADGNSFTAGQDVATWSNKGTGGSDYDAVAQLNAYQESYDPTGSVHYPSFETSGHPFATHGAIKFGTLRDKQFNNESFKLSKSFSKEHSFVLYAVVHEPVQTGGDETGLAGAPFAFLQDMKNQQGELIKADAAAHTGLILDAANANAFPRVTMNSLNEDQVSGNYAFTYGSLTDSRFNASVFSPSVTDVFVIRVNKDRVAHVYNGRAQGILDPSHPDQDSAVASEPGNIFAIRDSWSWDAIGYHGMYVWPHFPKDATTRYNNYISAMGAFDKDLGDQKCRALARLLAEKYKVS